MGRDKLTRAIATILVVLMAAAPLAASVCTMDCGDGGGTCCCEVPAGQMMVQISAGSCCPAEASSPAAASLSADRLTGGNQGSLFPLYAIVSSDTADGPAAALEGFQIPVRGQARGRSSPLFLLNASFLI